MKDIEKYINNTKRKTKKAKLPALSTLHPTAVLPDGAAGIATFNASFGEDINNEFIEDLNNTIDASCRKFLLDKGFEEDQLDELFSIEMDTQADDTLSIVVNADLTISSLRELADALYPLVEKYDEEAYFDIATNNSISTEINVPMNLTEKLQYLDRRGFDLHCKDYGFEPLYEAMKDRLDSEDKQKLKNFISTTDDPEKVNIFMKGLLMEEDTPLHEDVEVNDEGETVSLIVDRLIDETEIIRTEVNSIITTANKYGLDVLRNSADLAVGALDDFIKYMIDVQDAANDEDMVETEEPLDDFGDEDNIEFEESVKLKESFETSYWRNRARIDADTIIDKWCDGCDGVVKEEDGMLIAEPLSQYDEPIEYEATERNEFINALAYDLDMWEENDAQILIGRFNEYYPTAIEFTNVTGLEYNKNNIADVVLDWTLEEYDDKEYAKRLAKIVAEYITDDEE